MGRASQGSGMAGMFEKRELDPKTRRVDKKACVSAPRKYHRSIRTSRRKPFGAYSVLEVPTNARPDAIKKAYHRLSMIHHPDKHLTAQAMSAATKAFQALGAAYDQLKDKTLRKEYDKAFDLVEDSTERVRKHREELTAIEWAIANSVNVSRKWLKKEGRPISKALCEKKRKLLLAKVGESVDFKWMGTSRSGTVVGVTPTYTNNKLTDGTGQVCWVTIQPSRGPLRSVLEGSVSL